MQKKDTIQQIVTKEDIKNALYSIGVGSNMIIEVHSSLSSFGYVLGGARTVVDVLMEIAEDGGTIVMPIQMNDNSEPSDWSTPAVSSSLWQEIRKEMPYSDPKTSDLGEMGAIVDNFRHREGVEFSSHPKLAYAAYGKYAKLLCNRQSIHFPLADESPAARLYELKGKVLLLGTGFETCTCMHLAEYHYEARPVIISGASRKTLNGDTEWKEYLDLDLDSSVFPKVGEIMRKKGQIAETNLGPCHMQFFSATNAIDETVKYFEKTVIYDLYR